MLDELRRRFEAEVEKIGATRVATMLGISRGTVYNWIANGNIPLDKLAMLHTQGMDVAFVVTGVRVAHTFNWDLMLNVVTAVEQFLEERKAKLPADKKANLIRVLYEKFSQDAELNQAKFKDFMDAVMATV